MTLSDTNGAAGVGHNSGARLLDDAQLADIGAANGTPGSTEQRRSVTQAAAVMQEFGLAKGVDATFARAVGDPRLEEAHYRILLAHATCMNQKGISFPSDELLADAIGKSIKTVQNCHSELISWNYICRPDRRSKEGREERKGSTTFIPPEGLTWADLHKLTRSLSSVADMRRAILENQITDFVRRARALGGSQHFPHLGKCNSPRGGNTGESNSPSGGEYFPMGKCTPKKVRETKGPSAALIIEEEQPKVTNNPREKKREVGSENPARATAGPSAYELAKACREEPPEEAEIEAEADRIAAAAVAPHRQVSPARAQETPPPTPAPLVTGTAVAVAAGTVLHGQVIEPDEAINPASLIGVVERKRDFAWVCPKTSQPQKLTFHYIENTIGAEVRDKASVRAWAKEEIASAIEMGKDGNLVGWLRKRFASDFAKFIQRRETLRESMPTGRRYVPVQHDPSWDPIDDDDRNPPPRARLTPFGDRDTPKKANQHAKALSVATANSALDRAWSLTGGLVSVSAVHFDLAINGFDDAGLGEEWLNELAKRIAISAVREAAKSNPAPAGLVDELLTLTPGFPPAVLKDIVATAFAEPWKTGIEWPRYDPATSPSKIADALREKIVGVREDWRAARLDLVRCRLFYGTGPGSLGTELEVAMHKAGIAVSHMQVAGVADSNLKTALITPVSLAKHAAELIAERAEDVIAFIVKRCRAIELELRGTESFDWRPAIPDPLMDLRAAFGIAKPKRARQFVQ